MNNGDKTEQPTQQRRKKAREQGQVARSRELSGALACAAGVWIVASGFTDAIGNWLTLFSSSLESSLLLEGTTLIGTLQHTAWSALIGSAIPLATFFCVAGFSVAAQGGLAFSSEALAPKLERISPVSRARQIFSMTTVSSLLKSFIPGAIITCLLVNVVSREWRAIVACSTGTLDKTFALLGALLFELAWKAALVMLIWSLADYAFVRQKLEGDLRMSKEEVREEMKQTEGNPATKGRIRKIQRQARRARMLQALENATVVVTNPTHFAVALQYTPAMAAPVVVAKGQNLLAQELKRKAFWLGIAVVENKPLAQTLYRAVDVGRAIPADLYAAVAEVLAFVFRVQSADAANRQPGGRA